MILMITKWVSAISYQKINIFTESAETNDEVPKEYQGLDRFCSA